MAEFLVLSNSHKDSKLTDAIVEAFSEDIANNSVKARWMIPDDNARSKMVRHFFNDFVIYQSVVRPYKLMSHILFESQSGECAGQTFIAYALQINQDINSNNSIN